MVTATSIEVLRYHLRMVCPILFSSRKVCFIGNGLHNFCEVGNQFTGSLHTILPACVQLQSMLRGERICSMVADRRREVSSMLLLPVSFDTPILCLWCVLFDVYEKAHSQLFNVLCKHSRFLLPILSVSRNQDHLSLLTPNHAFQL